MLTICITGHHVICLTAQVKQDMKDFNTLVTAENKKFECPQTKIGTRNVLTTYKYVTQNQNQLKANALVFLGHYQANSGRLALKSIL